MPSAYVALSADEENGLLDQLEAKYGHDEANVGPTTTSPGTPVPQHQLQHMHSPDANMEGSPFSDDRVNGFNHRQSERVARQACDEMLSHRFKVVTYKHMA